MNQLEDILNYNSNHIMHPSFTINPINKRILNFKIKEGISTILLQKHETRNIKNVGDFAKFGCGHNVLTREGESHLFIKYNYIKFLIFHLQNDLRNFIDHDTKKAKLIFQKIKKLIKLSKTTKNEIAMRYQRLIVNISRNISNKMAYNRDNYFSELISDGYTKIFDTIDKFDFNLGFKFSTYFQTSVYRDYYSKQRLRGRKVQIDYEYNYENVVDYKKPRWWSSIELDEMISILNEREQFIIRNYYLNESTLTLQELSDIYNLTRERIRQIKREALVKVRDYIKEHRKDILEIVYENTTEV